MEYFSKGIVLLNEAFTQNKTGRHVDYFNDPVMRSGYLAYFLPVNIMKAYGILRRHCLFETVPETLSIVDIGAGPLTLSFSLILYLAERLSQTSKRHRLIIDAYDINKKILLDGATLLRTFLEKSGLKRNLDVQIRTYDTDIHRAFLPRKEHDVILLGNFLNEFEEREEQRALLKKILLNFCGKKTKILFLEPGSKKVTRDLQMLRDQLIESKEYTVLGPCLHQHTCPLNLTAKGDWCNFTQDWRAPDFIRDFDSLTELKKKYLLYSYLVVEKSEARSRRQEAGNKICYTQFVAISEAMREKGRLEVVGCGPAGRIRFVRSNNDVSETNRDFEWIRRGELFDVPSFRSNGEFQLNINVPVKKETRFVVKKG